MTKEQEFLEILKDPTGAALLKIIKGFQDNYLSSISFIGVEQTSTDEYIVRIETGSLAAIRNLEQAFYNMVVDHPIAGVIVNLSAPVVENFDGTFVKTYRISK